MPQPTPCQRCKAARLAVVYYDADGRPLGGHLHCPECGARHSTRLLPPDESVKSDLLQRKAS